MKGVFGGLLMLLSACAKAEWTVLYPNVMTVALGVSSPDDQRVYVSGGDNGGGATILKSSDAGVTWGALTHDLQMMYLDVDVAPKSDHGIAGSLGFYGQVASASYTEDGNEFYASPHIPLFSASQSVTAVDSQTSYYVGSWLDGIREEYIDGIISSFDAGKTVEFIPWGGEVQSRYGSFPTNETWFISGGTWPASKRSTDSIHYFNQRVQIKATKDGKRAVEINANPLPKNDGYKAVIRKTTDGGKTFTTSFNDTGMYFNGISCIDERRCWVTADGPVDGYIYHTADGGETWNEQFKVLAGSLIDVKILPSGEGWAVGGYFYTNTFDSVFLHTTNGGETWTEANTITNAYPNAIAVPSSERAYSTAFLRNGLSSILGYQQ